MYSDFLNHCDKVFILCSIIIRVRDIRDFIAKNKHFFTIRVNFIFDFLLLVYFGL